MDEPRPPLVQFLKNLFPVRRAGHFRPDSISTLLLPMQRRWWEFNHPAYQTSRRTVGAGGEAVMRGQKKSPA